MAFHYLVSFSILPFAVGFRSLLLPTNRKAKLQAAGVSPLKAGEATPEDRAKLFEMIKESLEGLDRKVELVRECGAPFIGKTIKKVFATEYKLVEGGLVFRHWNDDKLKDDDARENWSVDGGIGILCGSSVLWIGWHKTDELHIWEEEIQDYIYSEHNPSFNAVVGREIRGFWLEKGELWRFGDDLVIHGCASMFLDLGDDLCFG